jgi:hypothetical protein
MRHTGQGNPPGSIALGVAIFCGEGYEIGGSAFDGKEAAWIATHLSVS